MECKNNFAVDYDYKTFYDFQSRETKQSKAKPSRMGREDPPHLGRKTKPPQAQGEALNFFFFLLYYKTAPGTPRMA